MTAGMRTVAALFVETGGVYYDPGLSEARAAGIAPVKRLTASERVDTPPAFRDVLIALARTARVAP